MYTSMGATTAQVLSSAAELIRKSGPAVSSGLEVVRDPYFPEALCLAQSISDSKKGKPTAVCPRTPPRPETKEEFGLRVAIAPLRALDFHVKNPIVLPMLAAGFVGLLYYAGYSAGKRRR